MGKRHRLLPQSWERCSSLGSCRFCRLIPRRPLLSPAPFESHFPFDIISSRSIPIVIYYALYGSPHIPTCRRRLSPHSLPLPPYSNPEPRHYYSNGSLSLSFIEAPSRYKFINPLNDVWYRNAYRDITAPNLFDLSRISKLFKRCLENKRNIVHYITISNYRRTYWRHMKLFPITYTFARWCQC